MTAAGMQPENSRVCLSLSQSPSYHVQQRSAGGRLEDGGGGAALVEAAVDGSLDFPSYVQPGGGSVVYHMPWAALSAPRVDAHQTGGCCINAPSL